MIDTWWRRVEEGRATCIAVGLVNEGITIAGGEIKGGGRYRGVSTRSRANSPQLRCSPPTVQPASLCNNVTVAPRAQGAAYYNALSLPPPLGSLPVCRSVHDLVLFSSGRRSMPLGRKESVLKRYSPPPFLPSLSFSLLSSNYTSMRIIPNDYISRLAWTVLSSDSLVSIYGEEKAKKSG